MKIKELELKNYRKFEKLNLKFNDQINIVYAKNESGKSTVIDSIITALFVDVDTNSKKFIEQSYSWNSDSGPQIRLILDVKNDTLKLNKDFANSIGEIELSKNGKKYNNPKNIKKIIESITGLKDELVYKSTGVFKNMNLAEIEEGDKKKLSRALQSVSLGSSGNSDVQLILLKLDKEITELKLGLDRISKNPGKIRLLQDQLVEETSLLSNLKSEWQAIQSSYKTNDGDKDALKNIKKKIADLSDFIEKNQMYEEGKIKYDSITNEIKDYEERITGIKQINAKVKSYEDKLKEYKYSLEEIEVMSAELLSAIADRKSINKNISDLRQVVDNKNLSIKEGTKTSNPIIRWIGPLFIMLIGLLLAVLLSSTISFIIPIGISLFITIIYISILLKQQGGDIKKTNEDLDIANSKLKAEDEKLRKVEEDIRNITKKFECESEEMFFERKAKFINDTEYLKELAIMRINYEQKGNLSALESRQSSLILEKKEIEIGVLKKYSDYSGSRDSLILKKRELQKLQDEEVEIRENQIASQTRLKDAKVDIDQIVLKEERIEQIKRELSSLNEKLKVLEIVRQNLDLAIKNTAIGVSEYIKMEIEKYLPELTEDRYSEVKILDDFTPMVFSKEKNDFVDPSGTLSSGTLSQIYFLARVAYFKSLIGDARPPIIIDDAFVSFDETRSKALKKILEELAEEFQIFFFTCHSEYKSWGEAVELS
ncbi:MAG: AAA family ATPase [bacterium]